MGLSRDPLTGVITRGTWPPVPVLNWMLALLPGALTRLQENRRTSGTCG